MTRINFPRLTRCEHPLARTISHLSQQLGKKEQGDNRGGLTRPPSAAASRPTT